jgi:type II secretory ATPase GspE/PulE/Tfp pilus assembly ATPase PilB-like protein
MGGLHTFIPKSFRGRKVIAESIPMAEDASRAFSLADANIFTDAERSIIKLVDLLVGRAHESRASDIHLDPRADVLCVRLRIDGVLSDAHMLPMSIHGEIISRIKILSGMRIDEHYGAQDGRFRLVLPSRISVDVRVSIVPTYYGENAVLRLLSDAAEEFSLSHLGFTVRNRDAITRALARPYGMILATGPTGSGKTTSMYTLVKLLNEPGISIVTLEDPIEYSIPGISQIQINPKAGLSFGTGLRSVLRQDPNVIMVGEIRDEETAGLAVNTALTGHRILSTLHTNDAATTIARLLDMGVEPYLIASTVSIAIGQRLVRRICGSCKAERRLTDAEMMSLSRYLPTEFLTSQPKFFTGAGCDACNGSGFHGRAGIHEVMEMNGALREAILAKLPASEIRAVAVQAGMVPIMIDGFRKAAQGITSVEEVLKTRYE